MHHHLNKKLDIESKLGLSVGICLLLATLDNRMIIPAFLLSLLSGNFIIAKSRLYILFFALILIFWMLIKEVSVPGVSRNIYVSILPFCFFAAFSIKKISTKFLLALLIGFLPILILEYITIVLQRIFQVNLFGQQFENFRSDGVRAKGLFESSFYSLSLMICFTLLYFRIWKAGVFAYALYIILFLSGTLRSLIFILLFSTRRYVYLKYWTIIFCISIISSVGIFMMTYLSVHFEFYTQNSGNFFRVNAWKNAIEEISNNSFWGTKQATPTLSDNIAINLENISAFRIFESKLLTDAVNYGFFFVIFKLTFFFMLGAEVHLQAKTQVDHSKYVIQFIPAFLVLDYCVFGFLTMHILGLIMTLLIFSSSNR
jgi:hypothetical protein